MSKVLISIPPCQRSKIIAQLIEHEIERREQALYHCAIAVEEDHRLNQDMIDWGITSQDGLTDESW